MRRVVIVGGGYAGVTLAAALDAVHSVVLIERRDRFFHNVGAMRAYANPSLFERLLIPYDRLLRRGRVVQAEALRVGPHVVDTSDGGKVEGDVIVVATGSRHRFPFKNEITNSKEFLQAVEPLAARLANADSVCIQGDGPVAVELAGEISWTFPKKQIQLVAAADCLLPGAGNPRLGETVLQMLRRRGVEVRFGQRTPGDGAELVIPAFGAVFTVPCLGSAARVPVNGQFQVPGLEGVYAIGDAAECGEPPLTFLARRQANHLARYLRRGYGPEYRPSRYVAMAVPLGPEEGAVQLPLPGLPVFGSWLTNRLKGRDLFIRKNWSLLNSASQ